MIDALDETTRPLSEFAARLGVHVNTLKRAAPRGELDVVRVAGTRTTEAAVRRWIGVALAPGADDIRHICPLQLGVIDRLVRLYSDPGETVFSPFAGIGSEGFVALKRGRRFYGCEIKPEYHAACLRNLKRSARSQREQVAGGLF